MNAKKILSVLLMGSALVTGCQTYQYRVVQPPGVTQPVADQPVPISYPPLEYSLMRHHDRLEMRINNPTDDRVVLLGNRSSVVDPHGQSHPLRSLVIAAHSQGGMLLPPEPMTVTTTTTPTPGWAWGWGWGPYPIADPFFMDFYPPLISYTEFRTPYDWEWHRGPVQLHLTYERKRTTFDNDFEFVREPEEKNR